MLQEPMMEKLTAMRLLGMLDALKLQSLKAIRKRFGRKPAAAAARKVLWNARRFITSP